MKNSVKVSIIIPVYNAEKYISRCLDSLVSQTLPEIEIICINDLSTDKSCQIIEEKIKKDSRIKLYSVTSKKGAGGARNIGLEYASGEYIGFCDADDSVEPTMYEDLYKNAISVNADICEGGLKTYWEDKLIGIDTPKQTRLFENKDKIKNLRYGAVWNKIFKSTLAKSLKFSENRYCEDSCYTLKQLCRSQKFLVINKSGYHYFTNPSSVTNDISKKNKWEEDKFFSIVDLYDFCVQNHIDKGIIKSILCFCQKTFDLNYNNKKLKKNFFKICKSYTLRKALFKEYALTNRFLFVLKSYLLFPIYISKIYQILKRENK